MKFGNGKANAYPTPEVEAKVVLLGHYYCGKTSLLERFLTDRFIGENRYQNTIGASYGAKKVTLNDKRRLLLGVWDTAGSERYESMSRMYYRDQYYKAFYASSFYDPTRLRNKVVFSLHL